MESWRGGRGERKVFGTSLTNGYLQNLGSLSPFMCCLPSLTAYEAEASTSMNLGFRHSWNLALLNM